MTESSRAHYPRPAYPVLPVLSWRSLYGGRRVAVPSLLAAPQVQWCTAGRMAIANALQAMHIGVGAKVLIPAYHCLAMVYPVQWCGATCDFYQINPDLSVDLADIQRRIDPTVKVLMVTHYFGMPQSLRPLRELCDRHGIFLLEDCAHALFGEQEGRPLGAWGDYAIASPMKFYPSYDGGCLVSSQHRLSGTLRGNSWGFELKTALNTLERAWGYGRLRPLALLLHGPLRLKDGLWRRIKARWPQDHALRQLQAAPASEGGFGFDAEWIDRRMSMMSRWILRLASPARVVRRRQAHYRRLSLALANVPGCRPLWPELPATTVPYMFPLLVDEPDRVFPLLKQRAIPLLRFAEQLWPTMASADYPVAQCYSRHLLQLPCHQELRSQELDWIIAQVRAVFLDAPPVKTVAL